MKGEYVLAVDSSTSVGWVTLARIVEGLSVVEVLAERSINAFSHAEALLPAIHAVLSDHSISAKDLSLLVFGDGPGSFTGLRIGSSVLAGIAFGTSVKLVGVASHVGFACAYAMKLPLVDMCPLHIQVFSNGGEEVVFSSFRITTSSVRVCQCLSLILMESVKDWDSLVVDLNTIMLGTECLWKARELPSSIQPIDPKTLPISTGLIFGLYARDTPSKVEYQPEGDFLDAGNRSFVSDTTNGIFIRYGQPIKAQTLYQRRGW